MPLTRTWQDFFYYLRISHFYRITFYDIAIGTTRTEEGWVWRKGRIGFEFEVIDNDMGIITTYIRYRDIRAAQELM
jgi:hypothetical protein